MNTIERKTSFLSNFAQIAWVVKDITVAERFFGEAMGIGNFSKGEKEVQKMKSGANDERCTPHTIGFAASLHRVAPMLRGQPESR
jgi:hypothetical protein